MTGFGKPCRYRFARERRHVRRDVVAAEVGHQPGALIRGKVLVVSQDMLERRNKKARRAAGGIEDGFVLLRVHHSDDKVNNVARRAELPGIALGAENGQQVFKGVTQTFAVVIGETGDFFQEEVEGFRIAVGQEHALEDVPEELWNVLVLVHLLDALGIEKQAFMAAEPLVEQVGPAVLPEVAGEERCLAAEFLGLAVHVVHEFVDQGDGDLFHLRFRVGHLSDQDVARGVDAGFGSGVKHRGTCPFRRRDRPPTFRAHESRYACVDDRAES